MPSLAVTAVGLLLVQVSRDRLFHSADIVREPFHTLLSEGRLLSWYINLDPPFGLLLRCVAVQRPCDTKLKKDVSVLS